MARIKGISVTLYERKQTGLDGFNVPIYTETPVEVENVLVCPVSASDVTDTSGMEGSHAVYELCLPKGDAHSWENCRVDFWGRSWRVFGPPQEYIEALVPLDWNRKVKVERYE